MLNTILDHKSLVVFLQGGCVHAKDVRTKWSVTHILMYSIISLRSYFNNSPQVSNILCKIPWEIHTHTHTLMSFFENFWLLLLFLFHCLLKGKKTEESWEQNNSNCGIVFLLCELWLWSEAGSLASQLAWKCLKS